MKALMIFLLLFSTPAFATYQTVVRDASVETIPINYAGTGGELMNSVNGNRICCSNHTGSALLLCLRANDAIACGDDWYMADFDGFCFDDHALANKIYVKGKSGVIFVGILTCRVWTRN